MAISPELATFCRSWREKAQIEPRDGLSGAFDRFFTLFVVFNRLYAEATFRLARRGQVMLRDRMPDSRAAQDYVLQFCGAKWFIDALEVQGGAMGALDELKNHLRTGRFALKLDLVTGERQPEADRVLLAALESRSSQKRAKAVLEALYGIRCNMFHGHKGYQPIQLELLRPANHLLERVIDVLEQRLSDDGG